MTISNHVKNPQDGRYSSRYLSRKRVVNWDEAAYTVLTSARDASLHPGKLSEEESITIRNYNVTPQLPANGLTVAELFCGGGLMAVGLQAAGYDITFANDFDKRAAEAYAHNIGDHVICGDITDEALQAKIPDADIIAGGPPCQDYSVAGAGAGVEGERGKLVWTYLRIIADKQPKAFVFENVKGLLTKKHRPTFDALLAQFDEIGYAITWRLINAWDYGVAQKRERVFIVGVRKDLGFTFEFPEPSAEDYRTQVLRDVIGDLPEPTTESSTQNHVGALLDNVNPEWTYEKANRVASWESPAATVGGHVRNEGIHPGLENHAPDAANPPYIQNVLDGKTTTNYGTGIPVNDGSTPAKTLIAEYRAKCPNEVTAVSGKPRRFTVRECLRIQSVPDWYVLPESIKLSPQYRIVGNGVASRVSYVIGVALAEQLNAVLAQDLREAA